MSICDIRINKWNHYRFLAASFSFFSYKKTFFGRGKVKHPGTAWRDMSTHFLTTNLLVTEKCYYTGKRKKKGERAGIVSKLQEKPSTAGFTTWQIHILCFAIFLLVTVKNLQCLIIPSLVLWVILALSISLLILMRKGRRELWGWGGGLWKGRQLSLSHLNKWNVTDLTEKLV